MRLLEVENLNIYYGNIHAVHDLSLHVEEGEIVSLIGANGAGKSSVLRTISGLQRARSGSIRYNGREISRARPDQICKMGVAHVPEGRDIFTGLTVSDNIQLGQLIIQDSWEAKKADRKRFYDIFPRLRERKKQIAGTLSGGEQQMLAMGRAIMSRPHLMILDEPSMGLSPIYVQEIFQVIRKLHASGVTILLVEQNARMALRISDRAYVLETGRIRLEGDARSLIANPEVQAAYLGG